MNHSPETLADTLMDHSTAETLAPHGVSLPSAQPVAVGTDRATVLPRVEFEGEAPKLVTDHRKRFDALGVLGTGGVGEVSLAQDNDIRRQVALKRLRPDIDDPGVLVRFVEEIHTVGMLEHPNIVPIHDVGIDEQGRYYYVMKYVDGETLEEVIEKLAAGDPEYHLRYTFERRTELFLGVLRAIQYAHAQGIIHRDIKPANIMVGRYGEVLVMDWGIARQIRTPEPARMSKHSIPAPSPEDRDALFRTTDGALVGTPAYMSPEQARGDREAVDERSDVYALAAVFHELLTSRHYLDACQTLPEMLAAVATVNPPPPHAEKPTAVQGYVPAELIHFCRTGMSKNPAERFRSVTAMIDALENLRAGNFPVQCPVTFMKRGGNMFLHAIDKNPSAVMLGILASTLGFLGVLVAGASAMMR